MNGAGSNTVSTAEQTMLCMLSIVRNYPVGYSQIVNGGWDLAEVSNKAYDIEDKVVGIVGGGRIGQLVMQRLKVQACPASSSCKQDQKLPRWKPRRAQIKAREAAMSDASICFWEI